MEITYLSPTSVKIKGKQVSLLVNPSEKNKTPVEATLFVGQEKQTDFFNDVRGVMFQSPGEYEVKGAKVTGFTAGESVSYTLLLDSIALFIGTVSGALLAKEKLHEHDMALLIADDILSQGVLGVLNASVLVFLGEKSMENAKAFGKELTLVNKYVVTKDKLPQETEFIFLG